MTERLPLTKYHQVYLVLREQLQEGRFAQGVPAELSLAEQFGVGRVTVRRALEQLVEEGLIVRIAGRGTFPTPQAGATAAAPARGQVRPTRLAGLMENIVSTSLATSVKVLDWRVMPAPAPVAEQLRIPAGSKVRKAVRRRSSREGPLSYITAWVPDDLAQGITRRDLTASPLLQLLEDAGVELGRATQTISARQADAVVARELGVAIGTALLWVRRLVHDSQDRPVQWLDGLYRPDRYEYQMEVSGVGSVDARIAVKNKPEGGA